MKKTICRSFIAVLTAFLGLAVFSPVFSLHTAAAGEPVCGVRFEKEAEGDSAVVITAVLTKYSEDVNGVVLALSFDPSKVSISDDGIAVLSDGTMFSSKIDHEKGNVSAECAYFSGLSENTPLVSFRFSLADRVAADSIDQSMITLCDDNEFLSGLSPNYAWSRGVYLTNGMDSYNANNGVEIRLDIPEAPGSGNGQDKDSEGKTGGCSGAVSTAALIGGAVLLAAAVIFVRKGKKS